MLFDVVFVFYLIICILVLKGLFFGFILVKIFLVVFNNGVGYLLVIYFVGDFVFN